jgi:hypothetical protein
MPNLTVARLEDRLLVTSTLADLNQHLRVPTATFWNRLEGRPRTDDLQRAFRAEVRDPLWMLSRQWQLGEFAGADSGTPIDALLLPRVSGLAAVALGSGDPQPYDAAVPLEAVVEAEPVEIDLLAGLHIGRRWRRELRRVFGAATPLVGRFTTAYAVRLPDPADPNAQLAVLHVETHRAERQLRRALEGKSLDGSLLAGDMRASLHAGESPFDAFRRRFTAEGLSLPPATRGPLEALSKQFLAWLEGPAGRFRTRSADAAWQPAHLEHRFSVTTAGDEQTVLSADEYPGGRLDWYSFDADREQAARSLAPPETGLSFIPAPVRFHGMPNVRWWEFEDRLVGFGLTTASKTDLVKMLLAEFGLVFANDWFMVPFAAPAGSLIEMVGIRVTDNFGRHSLVEPTVSRHAQLGLHGRWSIWSLTRHAAAQDAIPVDPRLFLAPALPRSIESPPIDEVLFLRDEGANLVWAVEHVIPDPMGGGRDGRAAGQLLRDVLLPRPPAAPGGPVESSSPQGPDDLPVSYQLMNRVPENWIPFVAVQLAGETTARVLLQGAMPRIPAIAPRTTSGGDLILAHNAVLPRGRILSQRPVAEANVIYEEEILRGGALVRRTVQQTRWHGGTVATWCGRTRRTGRGEAASGLGFDQISTRKPGGTA